jgi:hypothetical protein
LIDSEEGGRIEDLEGAEPGAGSEGSVIVRYGSTSIEEAPELILDAAELDDSGLEPVEDEELALSLALSSPDFSALSEWSEEGDADAYASREAEPSFSAEDVSEPAAALRFTRSDEQAAAPEADDSAVRDGEIPMLTDEMRELLEYLPSADVEDRPPADLEEYLGPFSGYSPTAVTTGFSYEASEELPVVGEGDPWSEAEFLGELLEAELEDADGEEPDLGEDGPIVRRDGIFQLNDAFPRPIVQTDPSLRELVDSVLGAGDR